MTVYLASLLGGGLIGLSVAMLLLNGRIAGISGLVAGIGTDRGERRLTDILFVYDLPRPAPAADLAVMRRWTRCISNIPSRGAGCCATS